MHADSPDVHFTERMEPGRAHPRIFWEHVYRYRFAKDFARGKRVLDIACGEGYGSQALARAGAAHVIGIDIAPDVCEHARRKYGLDARVGDAERIPLPDRSIDLTVSFETLEHVADPPAFLEECARVLVADGTLVVSTPNRPVYTGEGTRNPFHQVEYDVDEFRQLLLARFRDVRLFTQFPRSAAWWSARSLCAERSPWLRLRGYWRICSWLCPAIRNELDESVRDSAVDSILARDRPLGAPFNPYIVRPYSERIREEPYVLVAVAQGVRKA